MIKGRLPLAGTVIFHEAQESVLRIYMQNAANQGTTS